MDGWMDGWGDACTPCRRMFVCMSVSMDDSCMYVCMEGWMYLFMDVKMKGKIFGWMDG